VEDVKFESTRIVEVEVEERVPLSILKDVANRLNLVPTGKEDEDVTFFGFRDDVSDDESEERVRHVEVVDLSDGFAGSMVDRDRRDEFSLEVGADRLLVEDPSSSVLRNSFVLELLNDVVEPELFDRE
jgi:hypothetical protein